mmetsp:Transcript_12641/g.16310  ORF Transcript_12641/g.16310 Transcript_12641/m.16310 type:complete len:221 (+) Transcript_12641:17-679(+)
MDVETLKSDLVALQVRLKEAGLDDSLPSDKHVKAAAVVEAKKEQTKSASYLDDEEPRSAEELAQVKAAADAMDMELVASIKTEGNEFFRTGDFKNACSTYMKAIRMLDKGELVDAKLFSNMAASQLALDKYVAAAMYGQRCMEADPDWWKGYWYRGQALMKMLRNKPPSTAMSERCEQAKFAFEGCLKTSTLPESKKQQVEEELQTCKNALMQMTGCGQQ